MVSKSVYPVLLTVWLQKGTVGLTVGAAAETDRVMLAAFTGGSQRLLRTTRRGVVKYILSSS